jgi:hypothetical protein
VVAIVRLLFYGISLVGMSLEVCVLWRMLRTRQWRVFPFFFFYMCYLFAGTLVLSTMFQIMGLTAGTKNSLYGDIYWGIETAGIALRFLIIWEVFRHLFPQGTSLNRIVSKKFAWAAAGLVVFAMGSFWSYATYAQVHAVYPALDRCFGFVQAVMVLGMLLTATYYELPLTRNLLGIAVGFGAYVSILTANNAMIDLHRSFLPFWTILGPLSSLAMLGTWAWATWSEVPQTPPPVIDTVDVIPGFERWAEGWNQTTATVRKDLNS